MKAQAKPVIVDYFKIVEVGPVDEEAGFRILWLDDQRGVVATKHMLSRIDPKIGDYWVVQEDGYTYLNPKDVFERKYSPIESAYSAT